MNGAGLITFHVVVVYNFRIGTTSIAFMQYEVWDKVHKHYNSQMKARVHQLCAELKIIKKGTQSIYEFVLCIKSIIDSLLAIDDPISECDQIYVILQGLPEEYNPFIMMAYNKTESMDIYEVEGLLYVQ